MDTIKQGNIAVQAENIFPIIKKFLYSEHEIFLRELIANAVDATTKLQALAMRGAYDEELGDLTIDILIDKAKGTLTIRDRGIGMTAEEVDKYLNQVALSSAREFVEKYQSNVQLIGIEPTNKKDRGTDVVLYLSDEHREYLEPQRVEEIARKYCGFMPIPIRLGKKSVSREIKENGKTKIVQEEVDNQRKRQDENRPRRSRQHHQRHPPPVETKPRRHLRRTVHRILQKTLSRRRQTRLLDSPQHRPPLPPHRYPLLPPHPSSHRHPPPQNTPLRQPSLRHRRSGTNRARIPHPPPRRHR